LRDFTALQPESGFTLLEILVAISIFAIVITTILFSYRSVFSNVDAINQSLVPYATAQNCLDRMIVDLQSTHVSLPPEFKPPDFDGPTDPFRFVGDTLSFGATEFQRLRFASLAHLPLGNKNRGNGIAEIVYYVQAEDEDHFVLKRADRLYNFEPSDSPSVDPVLCENLRALTFKYYDSEGTAYDAWNSAAQVFGYATPVKISIRLEVNGGTNPLVFETMVTLPVHRQKEKE
jgi:general secretion pathway protein J